MDTLTGIAVQIHLITETFGFSNKFFKKWLLCLLFSCGEIFAFLTFSPISQDKFRYEAS